MVAKRILKLKSRKKLIRGFRRHLRSHQRRAASSALLDVDHLRKTHRDYEKLGLAPWAVNEYPPLPIRQLWVSKLVADFHDWYPRVAAEFSAFYLAVWLFEPSFGESQLVVAVEAEQDFYAHTFGPQTERPLPPEYQQLPGVAKLRWSAHVHLAVYWPDEFAELGAWAASKPHQKIKKPNGESYYAVQIGWVWVGQKSE